MVFFILIIFFFFLIAVHFTLLLFHAANFFALLSHPPPPRLFRPRPWPQHRHAVDLHHYYSRPRKNYSEINLRASWPSRARVHYRRAYVYHNVPHLRYTIHNNTYIFIYIFIVVQYYGNALTSCRRIYLKNLTDFRDCAHTFTMCIIYILHSDVSVRVIMNWNLWKKFVMEVVRRGGRERKPKKKERRRDDKHFPFV